MTPLLNGTNVVYSGNLAAFRQVLGNNSAFYKPPGAIRDLRCVQDVYLPLIFLHVLCRFMGMNVVASEDEVWRRHRRIVAPAFNHTTYRNVWMTTARVYHDMIEKEGWTNAKVARIVNTNIITHKVISYLHSFSNLAEFCGYSSHSSSSPQLVSTSR